MELIKREMDSTGRGDVLWPNIKTRNFQIAVGRITEEDNKKDEVYELYTLLRREFNGVWYVIPFVKTICINHPNVIIKTNIEELLLRLIKEVHLMFVLGSYDEFWYKDTNQISEQDRLKEALMHNIKIQDDGTGK
jgi:hypothetical protein